MWKHLIILRRSPLRLIGEILFPLAVCLLLYLIRHQFEIEEIPETSFEPFSESTYLPESEVCSNTAGLPNVVAFSPKSLLIAMSIDSTCSDVKLVVPFETKADLDQKIDSDANFSSVLRFAVAFSDNLKGVNSSGELPEDFDMTLRLPVTRKGKFSPWRTKIFYSQAESLGHRQIEDQFGGTPHYHERGFLYLQQSLSLALMNEGKANGSEYEVKMQRFPFAAFRQDQFFGAVDEVTFETGISQLLIALYLFHFCMLVKGIAHEKEQQLKESMKVMGIPGWLQWLSWFTYSLIVNTFAVILATIMLTIVFPNSNGFLLFLFVFLYLCTMITLAFFISTLFTKASVAAMVALLFFAISFLPYQLINRSQDSGKPGATKVLAASLFSCTAVGFGTTYIFAFETIGTGIHFDNLFTVPSPHKTSLGDIFIMLIVDSFLYLLLALYIEMIYPGEFGVPLPWYFLCTRSFWFSDKETDNQEEQTTNMKKQSFEVLSEDLPVGIKLMSLSKTFGSHKAVRGITLDMYQGHLTVLLGHNGAGKTTTMNMIAGMIPPTNGTALINNYDVRKNPQKVRDSMGLCLQHNVVFDQLTVEEHLFYFGQMKGVSKKSIKEEMGSYLKILELENKVKNYPTQLSGGMKRKLCVAIALCGKSKVVMLDEPTAGMDPSARRTVWNLLKQEKEGRTILLTTHFMDEADLLGDRVAIMAAGEIQCCGSSFFLKQKYGGGYYLVLDVTPRCRPERITGLLRKHIPEVDIHSFVGSELKYHLPGNEAAKFESLLRDLEANMSMLEIRSYGISLTSLEEVFMKIGADHDADITKLYAKNANQQASSSATETETKYLSGIALIPNQILAMLLKKVLSTIRSWPFLLIQFLLPIILLVITYLLTDDIELPTTYAPLKMSLESYDTTITLAATSDDAAYQRYERAVRPHKLERVPDVAKRIVEETKLSAIGTRKHYIVASDYNLQTIIAWFNGDPYHAAPLSLGLVLSSLHNGTITYYHHPLPMPPQLQLLLKTQSLAGLQFAFIMGIITAIITGFYIIFYIRERASGNKHLQFVSGVNVLVFWTVTFLCDIITYLITFCIIIIMVLIIQYDGLTTDEELGRLSLLFFSFIIYGLTSVYVLSFFFESPPMGYIVIFLIGYVFGQLAPLMLMILEVEELELTHIAKPLHWVFLFIPFYSLVRGLLAISNIDQLMKICKLFPTPELACQSTPKCCDLEYYSLERPGVGANILISFAMGLLLFLLLIINEYHVFGYLFHKIFSFKSKAPDLDNVDSDVKEEMRIMRETPPRDLFNTYVLVLRDVTKYYGKFRAVNGISLGVKPNECFGLLGENGAGKTTTFKMITGHIRISHGDAFVNGVSISSDPKTVQKYLGYCPQFDALLDDLTARETVTLFALIRGVHRKECGKLAETLAKEFDFNKHLDKRIKNLSGGNKRKVSAAVATTGDPPIVYLDEPSTGMDPAAKRIMWAALAKLREKGKSIILTSHSMEECEALCTRMAIMVNGNFKCIGSSQRLKNRFAQAYSLIVKVKKPPTDRKLKDVDEFVKRNFPGSRLVEQFQEMATYELGDTSVSWSKMFGTIEKNKKNLLIDEYSLGQCSLEQVFLSFVQHQD
ncbi:phospholipid-transporting ATPase ABCA1-like isoform X2 [Zophobas morio]